MPTVDIDIVSEVLKLQKEKGKVVLFLGAGASMESGNEQVEICIDRELERNHIDLAQLDGAERYRTFYQILSEMPPELRQGVLTNMFKRAEPTEGYTILAELAQQGFFDVIITTNFDRLLETSFRERGLEERVDYEVFVVGWDKEEALRPFLGRTEPSIKIVKLCGDLDREVVCSTLEAMQNLPSEAVASLNEVTRRALLLVGYGERDRSVIRILNSEGGSVWCASPAGLDWRDGNDRAVLQFLEGRGSHEHVLAGQEAQVDRFFRSLGERLTGGELPAVGSLRHLLSLSKVQTDRYLQAAQDKGGGQRYIPSVYCNRGQAEERIAEFLTSTKTGLIIVGHSGVGKTNLLCHLAERLLDEGNVVLLYNCAGSLDLDIEPEIKKDLSVAENVSCQDTLRRVGQEVGRQGKNFVVIFDAINEFRFQNANRTADLLGRIDSLIGRCQYPGVKFILSCKTSTWNHLERYGRTAELNWGAYYHGGEERVLTLERLTAQELEQAYPKYQEAFGLESDLVALPEQTKERCQDPLLLRMMAEVYAGRDIDAVHTPMTKVFEEYYEAKVREPPEPDEVFLEDLVTEMEQNETDSLSLMHLQRHESLREHIKPDLDCAYERLKDVGVLMEVPGDKFTGSLVRFTYDRVLEYTLARRFLRALMGRGGSRAQLIESLVSRAGRLPSLWGAARMALLLKVDQRLFIELAASQSYESRELVADALVSLHEESPDQAVPILMRILRQSNDDAKRVALKVAYAIGPDGKEVFVRGAADESEATRRAVSEYLYLALKVKPEYGNEIWDELMSGISIRTARRSLGLLQTVLEFSFKMLVDQSRNPEAIQRVSQAWHDIPVEKLHIGKLGDEGLGRLGRELLIRVDARIIKTHIIDVIFFAEYGRPEDFERSPEDRQRVEEVVNRFLDETCSMDCLAPLLVELFESPILFDHSLAVIVLAAACIRSPGEMLPIVEDIFEQLSGPARLWILFQFSYFAHLEVPEGYLEMLEEFVEKFIREDRDTFIADPWGIHDTLYTPLMAVGLAYCQKGVSGFPLVDRILQEAIDEDDFEVVEKCILGLAPVGYYYPEETLRFVEKAIDLSDESEYLPVVTHLLATIRTLYPDPVEGFLLRTGAGESLARDIRMQMDAELVKRYVNWIGSLSLGADLVARRAVLGDWLLTHIFLQAVRCETVEQLSLSLARDWTQLEEEHDWYIDRLL